MGCHHASAVLALLLILGDTHNFLFAEDPLKIVPCVDSGQNGVMYPAGATPTNCTASGPTEGLRCTIGNYLINHPDACEDVTKRLQSRAVATPPRLDEVCQPQLTNLNLYQLSCKGLEVSPEVSLNFTFELPLCAAEFANASTAVKVDFNANRDHPDNYFHTHPICRLFNYTGSDFSHISDFSQKITMFYEWMAVGIQDRSTYPEVVYYLSLTADPSAAQLNYTVVYLDVSSQSMRLVAGAWRSNGRAHFIFLPIDNVNNYRIEATSVGQAKWEHSEEVSSSTFELKDIPNYANIVTVKVTPTDRDVCDRLGYPCLPITITLLDKNTLNLPVDPLHTSVPAGGVNWRNILVITVGSLVAGVLIAATIAVLRRRQGRPAKPEGYEPAPEAEDEQPEPRQVLIITSSPESVYDEVLLHLLTRHGFKTDPLRDVQCKSRMRNNKPILLIIHPQTMNFPAWRTFRDLVLYISENPPLWRRVWVISLEDQGEVCRLQDLFRGLEDNRPRLYEFWTDLEERTHELRMPDDEKNLIAQLNEVYPGERPAVQVRFEEEEEAVSLISSASDISELGQRNGRNFGMDAEIEEPERANPGPFLEVQVNIPDRHAHYVVFNRTVPENEGEGHDLEPQSEVWASGDSTISDPQELVEQMNAPVTVEIHLPNQPSHFAASDEGHHVPQGPHLNPNDDNEISDGLHELHSSAVLPQRLPPDSNDASSRLLPTLERGDGLDPDETTPKVPLRRDPAWGPKQTTPKVPLRRDLSMGPEQTTPKVPLRRDPSMGPEQTTPKVPLRRDPSMGPEQTTPKVPLRRDPSMGPEQTTPKVPLRRDPSMGPEQTTPKVSLRRDPSWGPEETTPKDPLRRESTWGPEHLRTTEDIGGAEIFDSRQHVPHLSALLSSSGSGSVVSREETENREQVLDASEGRLQGKAAMPPPAVREGEENSYHSSLGPSANSLESEPRLSHVHQPCYDDRARGDNDLNSANVYSPSPPRVCGPEEYMSMLSQGSLGPGGNSVAGPLEEVSAVHPPPASGPAGGERRRAHEVGEERSGERSVLSGADAGCGPEDHPAFSLSRSSRQGRGESFSMTRQNGGIDEARNPPQEAVPERGGVDFDRARQNDEARNLWLEEAAAWESDDRASGFKAGAEHGNVNVPLTFKQREILPGRSDMKGEQPMPVAQLRAEGIRYDGHEDERGERVYEPLFTGDRRDNEQGEGNVRSNGNVVDNGHAPQARDFQRGEPVEHAERIDDDDPDSGVAWNPDSMESQHSQ